MSTLKQNEPDIIDIQDKIGYVDTGPMPITALNNTEHKPTIATNAHLTIKEPKPTRQIHVFEKPPPILKKKPSLTKGKEKSPQNRDEIKEMMVSKLYELADMLQSLQIEGTPQPTASTSEPQSYPLRRRHSQSKFQTYTNNPEEEEEEEEEAYYPYYPPPPIIYDHARFMPSQAYYYQDEPQQAADYYRLRPRRKSYGNIHDEHQHHYYLQRKGSRRRQRMIDPRYDYPPPPPQQYRYYYPQQQYSPTNGYYMN
ncbi:uncharacterized protein B0P05DRAFT_566774 [Gilbertella persicaria]|uniref:uncharacterized protein n=1 Tax=Gilbertella persicaria TaxID=101096 RepID=UPI002220C996|nr:uncharacterized protein B0P05DRAFT_566774 [Gilbertella persicaria]KAI8047128.1 hypothetical protein B0P05DRAFT_566774 [Gilbertella persicaria]